MLCGSSWDCIKSARVMLLRDEGCSRVPYKCPAGFWTIGVGRNLEANPLSDDEIALILDNDIDRARTAANEIFGATWFEQQEEHRQLGIINLIFNLGKSGFMQFKKAIGAMLRGDWDTAANEILDSRYAEQVGERAERVAKLLRCEEYPYP